MSEGRPGGMREEEKRVSGSERGGGGVGGWGWGGGGGSRAVFVMLAWCAAFPGSNDSRAKAVGEAPLSSSGERDDGCEEGRLLADSARH